MTVNSDFSGWSNLSIQDLILAYRKAKTDVYFERNYPASIKFAEYESDLLNNLDELLVELKACNGFGGRNDLLGDLRVIPKKLGKKMRAEVQDSHVHFSDPERAFEKFYKDNSLTPEFRVVGDFPVMTHIISALWINKIGHKFDRCLSKNCYGARLKRVAAESELIPNSETEFHSSNVGSFNAYFKPYQEWRSSGLSAIRRELECGRDTIAVSLDLKNYYHNIDPRIITSSMLRDELGLMDENSLSDEELDFTSQISILLDNWSKYASGFCVSLGVDKEVSRGGLVIGLTASRIISNVLLAKWDRLVIELITPVHYGRYVDDMFLVLNDPGTISSTSDFMHFMQSRLGTEVLYQADFEDRPNIWEIDLGAELQLDSKIQLQTAKQKLFVLKEKGGFDLLDSIEKDIFELSSEHRLMPSLELLQDSTSSKVLTAAESVAEHADTLRKADQLTIRRLSWALKLKQVESIAADLPAAEWASEKSEFFEFAYNHILRADQIFSQFVYLPRLLSFAVGLNEWTQAEKIVRSAFNAINTLQKYHDSDGNIKVNGSKGVANSEVWRHLKASLAWSLIESVVRSYDLSATPSGKDKKSEERLKTVFLEQLLSDSLDYREYIGVELGVTNIRSYAILCSMSDLAVKPYKKLIKSGIEPEVSDSASYARQTELLKLFSSAEIVNVTDLIDFLHASEPNRVANTGRRKINEEHLLPYLFPTRPYTPTEVSILAPKCIFPSYDEESGELDPISPSQYWAKYVSAVRGVWVRPELLINSAANPNEKISYSDPIVVRVGLERKRKVVVGITNLLTTESEYAKAASDDPALSNERYQRISELVNAAIKLRKPKLDYLVFPEVSIPRRWVRSIATKLASYGISMIAGVEYKHLGENKLYSEAYFSLADNRLGFPSWIEYRVPKFQPAPLEDKNLIHIHGREWDLPSGLPTWFSKSRIVHEHNGFHFGCMICSELLNSKDRMQYQGNVDALFVLSWNQDIDTFATIIEASALDIHAYMILVNNRCYGDSRIRVPSKEAYSRDIARVRGKENDFLVAATLDLEELRAFQSRAKRWPEKHDKFKPVPENFTISELRKKVPPR